MALVKGRMEQGIGDAVDAILQHALAFQRHGGERQAGIEILARDHLVEAVSREQADPAGIVAIVEQAAIEGVKAVDQRLGVGRGRGGRSEEHTSELQSLMRTSYAVFCLKK